jgi:hypothetical protein
MCQEVSVPGFSEIIKPQDEPGQMGYSPHPILTVRISEVEQLTSWYRRKSTQAWDSDRLNHSDTSKLDLGLLPDLFDQYFSLCRNGNSDSSLIREIVKINRENICKVSNAIVVY